MSPQLLVCQLFKFPSMLNLMNYEGSYMHFQLELKDNLFLRNSIFVSVMKIEIWNNIGDCPARNIQFSFRL